MLRLSLPWPLRVEPWGPLGGGGAWEAAGRWASWWGPLGLWEPMCAPPYLTVDSSPHTWASGFSDSSRSRLGLSLQQGGHPALQPHSVLFFQPLSFKASCSSPVASPEALALSGDVAYTEPQLTISLQAKSARILPSSTQVLGGTRAFRLPWLGPRGQAVSWLPGPAHPHTSPMCSLKNVTYWGPPQLLSAPNPLPYPNHTPSFYSLQIHMCI